MSFKYRVENDGSNRFVLPRTGNMKTEVVAFLTPELFAQTEERIWQQAVASASYEGVTGVYLMPDCSPGYGIPVGGVVVTDNTIIQSGSGYDISCGVVMLEVPGLHASDLVDWNKRKRWVDEVEKYVSTGVGSHRARFQKSLSHSKMQEVLRFGAQPLGVPSAVCERLYVPVDEEYFDPDRIQKASDRTIVQIGSVGGGNHYVELQVDQKDGSVWIQVHCGSRGYGWHTADWFFYAGAEARGLDKRRREAAFLYADEPLGKMYWAHHNSAANYAVANRHVIVQGIKKATKAIYRKRPKVYYEISHNLVQRETLVLPDGTTKKGFVHRKGATRAFPAGHPDLIGTPWEKTGHPCLIPGSMLDGAAIVFPLKGAFESGCSVNHGSGRAMSRSKAKRELRVLHKDIDDEMREVVRTFDDTVQIKGIVGNTKRTPLDECGHVYKQLDDVLEVLVSEGIAKIHRRLWPVANLKGTD